ncbi:MAG: hypothetical protein M3461_01225, partial [Pseudomonadota bacterium]|nr:hypothetical protein [Pseudomonadota bacterium]
MFRLWGHVANRNYLFCKSGGATNLRKMAVVKTLVVFKRGILWINKWPSCFYSATTRKKDGK